MCLDVCMYEGTSREIQLKRKTHPECGWYHLRVYKKNKKKELSRVPRQLCSSIYFSLLPHLRPM